MKTGLLVWAPDASGSGVPAGGESGAGGMAVGGNGGQTSTGPAVGGSTTVHVGGSGGNGLGGSTTVHVGGSGGNGLGGSTVARGGSGGNASGGNSLGGSGGRGGDSGSANRGGSGGSGGSSGRPGTGGAIVSSPDAAPLRPDAREVALPVGTPVIDPGRNSLTINAGTVILSGTVSSACAGTGSICGGLSYPENSFCSSGTVGASPTYSSWANAGFTVNQASGTSGSTKSLPFVGTSITVSYSNKGGSTLELQLWDGRAEHRHDPVLQAQHRVLGHERLGFCVRHLRRHGAVLDPLQRHHPHAVRLLFSGYDGSVVRLLHSWRSGPVARAAWPRERMR
jgi:hypothetical protein